MNIVRFRRAIEAELDNKEMDTRFLAELNSLCDDLQSDGVDFIELYAEVVDFSSNYWSETKRKVFKTYQFIMKTLYGEDEE